MSKPSQWDVKVQIAASQGGNARTVRVSAINEVQAVVSATMKLDDEGIDRWSLLSCSKVTS